MNLLRRRAVLALVGTVLALSAAVWLASRIVPSTRISWGDQAGGPGLTVSTKLPVSTCYKVLTPRFPWVRFHCDEHRFQGDEERPDSAAEPAADDLPRDLDSASDAE